MLWRPDKNMAPLGGGMAGGTQVLDGLHTQTYAQLFNPATVAGLEFWAKPETLAFGDGANITGWTDSSGNGRTAAPTAGDPICKTNILNGYSIARFDGTSKRLQVNYAPISQISAFIVCKWADLTVQAIIVALGCAQVLGSPSGGFVLQNYAAATPFNHLSCQTGLGGTWCDGVNTNAGTIGAGFQIVELVVGATASNVWLNKVNIITDNSHGALGTTVGGTQNFLNLGGNSTDTTDYHFFNGDIAEVLLYSNAVSSTNRANIENYLNVKYALGY